MTTITPLVPRQSVPNLRVPTVGGGDWTLGEEAKKILFAQTSAAAS